MMTIYKGSMLPLTVLLLSALVSTVGAVSSDRGLGDWVDPGYTPRAPRLPSVYATQEFTTLAANGVVTDTKNYPETCLTCVTLGSFCSSSLCCSNGTACLGGECVNIRVREVGEPCDFTQQQLGAEICNQRDTKLACLRGTCQRYEQPSTCRCRPGDDRQCASIESCSTGYCHSTKLRHGERCNTSSVCQSGTCEPSSADPSISTCATPATCLPNQDHCPQGRVCDGTTNTCISPVILGTACDQSNYGLCTGGARCALSSRTATIGSCEQVATKQIGESCAVMTSTGPTASDAMCRDVGGKCDPTSMVCATVRNCAADQVAIRYCDGTHVCHTRPQCFDEADAYFACENEQCKTIQNDPFLEECRVDTCATQFSRWVCCNSARLGLTLNQDGYVLFDRVVVSCNDSLACPFECCQRDVECPLSCLPTPEAVPRDKGAVVVEFEPAIDPTTTAATTSTAAGASVGAAMGGSIGGSVGGATGAGAATSAAGGILIINKLQFLSVTAKIGSKLNDTMLPDAYRTFADSFKWTLFQIASPVEDGVDAVSKAFTSFSFWWFLISLGFGAIHGTVWMAMAGNIKRQRLVHTIMLKIEYFWIEYTHLSAAQLSVEQLITLGIPVPVWVAALMMLFWSLLWPSLVAFHLFRGMRPELYDPVMKTWDNSPVHDPRYARLQPLIAHFTYSGRFYALWQILKALSIGVLVGFLGDYPLAQSYLLYITCLTDVCLQLIWKPFTHPLLGAVELGAAILQLIAAVLITHFTAESDPRHDNAISQLLMTCNLLSAFLSITVNWFFIFQMIAKRQRKKSLKKRKEVEMELADKEEVQEFLSEMTQAKVNIFAQAERDRRAFASFLAHGKDLIIDAQEEADGSDAEGTESRQGDGPNSNGDVVGDGSVQGGDAPVEVVAAADFPFASTPEPDTHDIESGTPTSARRDRGSSERTPVGTPELHRGSEASTGLRRRSTRDSNAPRLRRGSSSMGRSPSRVKRLASNPTVVEQISKETSSPNAALFNALKSPDLTRKDLRDMEIIARKAKMVKLRAMGAIPEEPEDDKGREDDASASSEDLATLDEIARSDDEDSDMSEETRERRRQEKAEKQRLEELVQHPLEKSSAGGLGSNHWGEHLSSPGLSRRKKVLPVEETPPQATPPPKPKPIKPIPPPVLKRADTTKIKPPVLQKKNG
eukprot:TRINITY_DN5181_c0_g1_i1.p1 TRINITY_DN5181_c0_g1~~TRINITY_DN5181_c0_g1_i1.p1  ORF type:complete len:1176 (+),score=212.32 TRINITY_DN5181_c0_g1_i1:27-3554(+)